MPNPTVTLLTAETSSSISVFGWFFYPLLFLSLALALYCVFTIHRQSHLTEVQKLKWVLFTLFLPIVGPLAYWLRLRADRQHPSASPNHSEGEPEP